MNELALLLLLFAVIIVAAYFYLKRRQQQESHLPEATAEATQRPRTEDEPPTTRAG